MWVDKLKYDMIISYDKINIQLIFINHNVHHQSSQTEQKIYRFALLKQKNLKKKIDYY